MVIYARGGSEGTAVEAVCRTGRWRRVMGSTRLSLHASASFLYVQLLITFFVEIHLVYVQIQMCIN